MTNERIEEILIRAALSGLLVTTKEIKGIYIYGSRLFETTNDNSDLDYCIVVEDNPEYKEYWQVETQELDLHIVQVSEYQRLLNECDDMALSMYFQREPIMKCDVQFNLDLPILRKSISTKANNSFIKFKKKLIIEEDYDVRASIKSLFHSIRLLDFGKEIADSENFFAYNQSSLGENIEWIEQVFEETNNNWEEIHKVFKPIYNEYATDFKKVAPKA